MGAICYCRGKAIREEMGARVGERHPEKALECTIEFKNQLLDGSYSATLLCGGSAEPFNDIEHPNRVVPEKRTFAVKPGIG